MPARPTRRRYPRLPLRLAPCTQRQPQRRGGGVRDPRVRSHHGAKAGDPGAAADGRGAGAGASGSGHAREGGTSGPRYGSRSNRPAASPGLRLWTRHASGRNDRSTGDAPGAEGGRGQTSVSTDTGHGRLIQKLGKSIRPAAAKRVFFILPGTACTKGWSVMAGRRGFARVCDEWRTSAKNLEKRGEGKIKGGYGGVGFSSFCP